MNYSSSEVAKKLQMTKDALRYYEREGLLPGIERDALGHRVFSQADVDWIFLIRCLRDTDMPIAKIKAYVSLLKTNDAASLPQRRALLWEHQTFLQQKSARIQILLRLIQKKIAFYDQTLQSSDPLSAQCMDYAAEWEHFRSILGDLAYE